MAKTEIETKNLMGRLEKNLKDMKLEKWELRYLDED